MNLTIERKGVQQVQRSRGVQALATSTARRIASRVSSEQSTADVVVDEYRTTPLGFAAASVTIRDVRARVWQARDGIFTRAAAGEGLSVTLKR